MRWDQKDFPVRFVVSPGINTRAATIEDQPYLDELKILIEDALNGDPGESGE